MQAISYHKLWNEIEFNLTTDRQTDFWTCRAASLQLKKELTDQDDPITGVLTKLFSCLEKF